MALAGMHSQRNSARAPTRASPGGSNRVSRVVRSQAVSKAGAASKEWLQSLLARFGPATERAANVATLEFEKPLVELDRRIKEVRCRAWRPCNPGHPGAGVTAG